MDTQNATQEEQVHYFGMWIDGVLCRFVKQIAHTDFEELTASRPLPVHFVAWHLPKSATRYTSVIAAKLAECPVIERTYGGRLLVGAPTRGDGFYVYGLPLADPIEALRAAWDVEEKVHGWTPEAQEEIAEHLRRSIG